MHDIKAIRDNPQAFDQALKRRRDQDTDHQSAFLLALDKKCRSNLTELQTIQEQRNRLSKTIGIKKSKGEPTTKEEQEVASFKERRVALEEQATHHRQSLCDALSIIPNLLDDDVPDGIDEESNLVMKIWGEGAKSDNSKKDHVSLGESLGLMDFSVAAHLSGARFVVLRGALAQLERALAAFMLDVHRKEHGYEEIAPPVLVRDQALYGTGQLPKFSEDLYQTREGWWLSPTAEVQLANIIANTTLDASSLPLRLTAYTQCFRSEAGAAGRDTRGMIRQHQFGKVELVSITEEAQAEEEHDYITSCAEHILQKLELPYRKLLLCSGDTGFAARKTYDLEVWMAGQSCYREISSSSNCGDFQARRLNGMIKKKEGRAYVHTLNASGLAVGRCLIALMEYYQTNDGCIRIPDALQNYMDGLKIIEAKK